ncbi:hypothetical protein BaRGS_00032448 [Batillaria attramentaria]|uniref:Uncharacterized protein n=1 Tax=Batillaria attramentaria TaxID=370345 RepID=A0ABD0JMS2_9CAEN
MARQLIEAIRKGDESEARNILRNEQYGCIDCQTSRRDGTALFWACAKGFLELVQLLIHKGANVNARTSYNSTPLIAAADRNRYQVMRCLVQNGADVNAQTSNGDTACHLAAYRGHLEAVKLLVEVGADLDLTNNKFRTPYDDAMRQGHVDILPYLDTSTQMFGCGPQAGEKKHECTDFKKADQTLASSQHHLDMTSHQRRHSSGSSDRFSSESLSRESSYEDCEVNNVDFSDRIRGREHDSSEFDFPDFDGPFSTDHPFSAPLSLSFKTNNLSSTTTDLDLATSDFSFGNSNDLSLTSTRPSEKSCYMTLNIPA